jgi:hypothetical protein
MLHVESAEDCGDIGFVTKPDFGIITVDLDGEAVVCRAEDHEFVSL